MQKSSTSSHHCCSAREISTGGGTDHYFFFLEAKNTLQKGVLWQFEAAAHFVLHFLKPTPSSTLTHIS